jgi:hypothetical protein
MKNLIARRTVLLGMGQAATFGSVLAVLPRLAEAGQAAAPAQKVVLTMLYPSEGGHSFDADAFRDRHLPLLKNSYGPAVERIELRVAPPPPPPPVLAAVSIWLASISEFITRANNSARAIAADMATITRSAPIVQYDVVEGQAGEAASSIIGGATVLSSYFFAPQGEGAAEAKWDAEYFGKTYGPKIVETYGADAIQRVEVARGELAQGGGKPLVLGAVHVYVKDANAFDTAVATDAVRALGAEAQQYSSVNPVTLVMNVFTAA